MRKILQLSALVIVFLSLTSLKITDNINKDEDGEKSKISVLYFHYSNRCVTCISVETVTEGTLKEYYPEKIKSGEIRFKSIDMDDPKGEEIAFKMGISGQTLIFINKDKKIDLTNDAFLYAKNYPDKLKAKIKETITLMEK